MHSRTRMERRGPPLAFKLWFAFCAAIVLSIMASTVWLLVHVGSDPASIGRFLGSIAQSYSEKYP